ncbi:hypothetical protein HRW14_25810 [Streptomyces lunaelactis]|uniref:hypothetical protein n=1 Tax=Streptomyces lunaelactis TaxID=1535768 RepID=UPI001584B170|nr:hypothetical protein [Streptomyces lunaelactis]NUK27417.1 hypothetical protein [Streptomyces lunaelactis]NUK53625.1 hypothetical protein [Streptomyces lunaelactis]NUK63689.1 hypothetical protein [Streptomyces lunaelactis]
MKRSGPLLTLLAGLLLGLFMLSLNATTGTRATASSGGTTAPPSPTAPSPSGPAPSTPAPSTPAPGTSASATASPRPDAEYAGRTADDTAAVSVSVRGSKAIGYFCDGRDQESWLRGEVGDDGSMRLTGDDGARLEGVLRAGKLDGTVEIQDRTWQFTAAKAVRPSGLYRATAEVRGAKLDGGWIVLPDGRQVGILKRDGKPAAAPRIDPASGAVTVDGTRLTARPVVP